MSPIDSFIKEFENAANPAKAKELMRFFKTAPGQYGEGDKFLGIVVPITRKIVKKYHDQFTLADYKLFLASEWHEIRLGALLCLVNQATKLAKQHEYDRLKELFLFYDSQLERANNWDLVDLSAPYIPGAYWLSAKIKETEIKKQLKIWYSSDNLWRQRVAIMSTFALIKAGNHEECFWVAEKLLDHQHDLIHKAVGWMLREVGKRISKDILITFLEKHADVMPRTCLRYAIEHFPQNERLAWLTAPNSKKYKAKKKIV